MQAQRKISKKTISKAKKLDVISQLEKGERIFDICHKVRLTQGSVGTARDNPDTITGSAKSGIKVFVCGARPPLSYQNEPCQNLRI